MFFSHFYDFRGIKKSCTEMPFLCISCRPAFPEREIFNLSMPFQDTWVF